MSAPTRVAFTMNDELAVEATVQAYLHDPTLPRSIRIGRIVVACLLAYGLIGAGVLWWLGEASDWAAAFILFSVTFPAAVLAQMVARGRESIERQAQKMFETDPSFSRTLGPRVVEFGPDGITLSAPHIRAAWPYHSVIRTHRTPTWYLGVLVGPVLLAIPREGFATRDDFEQFATAADAIIAANDGKVGVSAE